MRRRASILAADRGTGRAASEPALRPVSGRTPSVSPGVPSGARRPVSLPRINAGWPSFSRRLLKPLGEARPSETAGARRSDRTVDAFGFLRQEASPDLGTKTPRLRRNGHDGPWAPEPCSRGGARRPAVRLPRRAPRPARRRGRAAGLGAACRPRRSGVELHRLHVFRRDAARRHRSRGRPRSGLRT